MAHNIKLIIYFLGYVTLSNYVKESPIRVFPSIREVPDNNKISIPK